MKRLFVWFVMAFLLVGITQVHAQDLLSKPVLSGAWSPSGDYIVLQSWIGLWIYDSDLLFIKQLDIRPPAIDEEVYPSITFTKWSPDGHYLAAVMNYYLVVDGVSNPYGYLIIWETTTWTQQTIIQNVKRDEFSWTPDSTSIMVFSDEGTSSLRRHNASTGALELEVSFVPSIDRSRSITQNPLNSDEVLLGFENRIELFGLSTQKPIASFPTSIWPRMHPEKDIFVGINDDNNVEVWSLSERQIIEVIDIEEPI